MDFIAQGKNGLVENVLETSSDALNVNVLRMECWRVLIRSTVFLCEKIVNYKSPLWRGIHGVVSPEQSVAELKSSKLCCTPSSLDLKAAHYMARFDGEPLKKLEASLVRIVGVLKKVVMGKGGCSSRVVEYLFSIIRNLGVRMPFRSCSIAILMRELRLRQLWKMHDIFAGTRIEDIFGSEQAMKEAVRFSKSRYNGFVRFCGASHLEIASF